MVCSRSGVRLYAATPCSGPGLLCAAARFVSAKYATVWVLSRVCRPQEEPVSYTHLRAHETREDLVCRLLLEKKRRTYVYLIKRKIKKKMLVRVCVPGTYISPFVLALEGDVNSNPSSRESLFLRAANPRQDPNSYVHG